MSPDKDSKYDGKSAKAIEGIEEKVKYTEISDEELSNNNLSLPTFLFDENFEEEISTPRVKPNLIEKGLAAENLIDISDTGKIRNVEVIVNTGGAKYWSYREVNSNRNEIYRLTEDGLAK